jgi:predicted O-methyltransferase YrrM
MLPADAEHIAGEIQDRELRSAVELGSGMSTLVLAAALAPLGGRITSLEHERLWAERVSGAIADAGLQGTARVIHAPLDDHPLAEAGALWYSAVGLHALPRAIDLLLVDGPPANLPGMERGRYPALPVLRRRLIPGALVVLDDAGRPGERQILERWQLETGIVFTEREGGRITVGSAG